MRRLHSAAGIITMRNGNRLSSAADATPALTNAPASLNPAVWRVLSWSDPVASAAPFAVGVAVFVAHSLFDYSLPSIISHVAFLSLFAATALHIANTASGTQLAPQLRVPINAEWVTQAGASLAAGAVKLTQLADRCLAWSDSTLSARALAYTWLIARFSYLASAPYLFFCECPCCSISPRHRTCYRVPLVPLSLLTRAPAVRTFRFRCSLHSSLSGSPRIRQVPGACGRVDRDPSAAAGVHRCRPHTQHCRRRPAQHQHQPHHRHGGSCCKCRAGSVAVLGLPVTDWRVYL